MEFKNGSRGMLDICMFAEGSKNEQEISVVGDMGKVMKIFIISTCLLCSCRAHDSECNNQLTPYRVDCLGIGFIRSNSAG